MNEALSALTTGGDEVEALRSSFEAAAQGFEAETALLLLVEAQEPLRMRTLSAHGLTDIQARACEKGESVRGVSSSIVRAVIAERKASVLKDARPGDGDQAPAVAGHNYSVLCSPILERPRDAVLAVMYFQTGSLHGGRGYDEADAAWLEGYASAVGRAFDLHFQKRRRESELDELLQGRDRPEDAPELIGDSAATHALRRELHEVHIPAAAAPDPDPLLILGEKGTGKDLIARYLYAYSARRAQSFVAVNCAEISDEMAAARFFGHKRGSFTGAVADEAGLFRAAHRGVLFLDEICELSPRAQGTLLRVLENRTVVPVGEAKELKVDVQVVLATNRDTTQALAEGQIKPDLFDRFRTRSISLHPLRDRPWDIQPLAQHFIAHHERRMRKKTLGLTAEALRRIVCHAWPGNVRELARVCSTLITYARPGAPLDPPLLARCYPDILNGTPNSKAGPVLWQDVPMREAKRAFERELILARLERHNWNVRRARESLRLPKTTFQRYAAGLGISFPGAARESDGPAEQ